MWIEWNANDKLERSSDARDDRGLNDEHNAYYTCEGYWSEVWSKKLNMTEVDEGTWSEKNNKGGVMEFFPHRNIVHLSPVLKPGLAWWYSCAECKWLKGLWLDTWGRRSLPNAVVVCHRVWARETNEQYFCVEKIPLQEVTDQRGPWYSTKIVEDAWSKVKPKY